MNCNYSSVSPNSH